MAVWFSSDWHIGHLYASEKRGFGTDLLSHDEKIITSINRYVGKRDKLYILGDVIWRNQSLPLLNEISGIKELILGNHDKFRVQEYLKYFNDISGFINYKEFWLSHCPIHPQEIYRCRGNIHGHIHNNAATTDIGYPYFNVNVDMNNYKPISFDEIDEWFSRIEKENRTNNIINKVSLSE